MIGFLSGQITENQDGKLLLVVELGARSRIGYAVTVPTSPEYVDWQAGRFVDLHIHTHVREDALDLYGFASTQEKEIFLALLGVSGIGPKGAMGILSKAGVATLLQAIFSGDKDLLTQVPGVGKKTAERLVLELAEPLQKKMAAGKWADSAPSSSASPGREGLSSERQEAKQALLQLGYRESEIVAALKKLPENVKNSADIVRNALRELSRGAMKAGNA